jgi:hypothetical protein
VLEEAFDEPALCACASCALSQEKQQALPTACVCSSIDRDLRSTSRCATQRRSAHTRSRSTLPPIAPQYIIDGERVPLAAALQVRIVVMLCTAAQSIAIKLSVDDDSVGELAPIRVESELVDGARL